MGHEFACDSGLDRTRSNARHQAKVGTRTGGGAFFEEATRKSKWQAIFGVRQHILVDSDAPEHRRRFKSQLAEERWNGLQLGNRQVRGNKRKAAHRCLLERAGGLWRGHAIKLAEAAGNVKFGPSGASNLDRICAWRNCR
jgi:hypothetical protein